MNPTPLRLLHITDPHLLGDESLEIYDVNTTLSLRQVLQQALAESPVPPDAILVTGDIADDCSREAYARLRGLLQPWGVPVLCLPGNHDSPDLMSRLLNSDGFQYCGRADFGDWTIILLDSHVPRAPSGRIAESEFARLQSELRTTTDRPVLVCVHHLPVPVGSAWLDAVGLQNGPDLRAMLDGFPQVRAVLSGHVHQTFDAIAGRVRMIATPSTCAQFTPGLPRCVMDLRPPGYRWLALASDGSIHTEVRWLQGWQTTARPTDSRASTLMD
jgi:Icc protein